MVGNVLSLVFALVYILLNYRMYRDLIYPMLVRSYYRGPVNSAKDMKKDARFLVHMTVGWLLEISLWGVYVLITPLILMAGADENIVLVSVVMSGSALMLTIFATSLPKQIGSFY